MATQHGFWVSASDNRVFDGFVTRHHLIAHGDIVAINASYVSASYSFSFSNIVHRLKSAAHTVRWAVLDPGAGTSCRPRA
jgi:hypothetical protein